MLDTTTSSTDFPLFGTMSSSSSSSSFGLGSIKIQQPLPTESYSWCDFPIAMQYDSPTTASSSSFAPTVTNYDHHDYNCLNSSSSSSSSNNNLRHSMETSSSTSSLSSFSSSRSMFSSSSENSISTTSSAQEQQHKKEREQRSSSSKRHNGNVRFAPAPFVRTYSLVLGDHPHCQDGLAIELGWDYNEQSESPAAATAAAAAIANTDNKRKTILPGGDTDNRPSGTSGSCLRRSYLSRKQLLLDVAGCTTEELDQRKRDSESQRQRSSASKIDKEEYYYGLAFANERG